MKKILVGLVALTILIGCNKPMYYYTQTVAPQEVVDSLLNGNTSDFRDWNVSTVRAVYNRDSVTTNYYINRVQVEPKRISEITVIVFEGKDTSVVKEVKLKGKIK